MDERQAAGDQAKQQEGARIALLLPQAVKQQVETGEQKDPAGQKSTLRREHVGDDIAPPEVVGAKLGVVDGRLVPAVQYGAKPVQPGPHLQLIAAGRPQAFAHHVKAVQKAQPAVDEQQQHRKRRRPAAVCHARRQQRIARKNKAQHQCTRDVERGLQVEAHDQACGGEAVCQEGVAEPCPRQYAVISGKPGILKRGDDAGVQRQIAVGALPDIERAVLWPQVMGVLKHRAEDSERQGQEQQQPDILLIFIPKGPKRSAAVA